MRFRLPFRFWPIPPWPVSRAAAPHPLILLYHSVSEGWPDPFGIRVSPRNFAEHMAILRAHCHPIRLDELDTGLRAGTLPERSVAVTFDDGFVDNLRCAKPVLQQHRIPATIFIATGYVGSDREYWWEELEGILLKPGRLPDALALHIGDALVEWELNGSAVHSRLAAWKARHWRVWHGHDPTPRHALFRTLWAALRRSNPDDRDKALRDLRTWAGSQRPSRPQRRCVKMGELIELASGDLIEIGAHTVNHPALAFIPQPQQQHEIAKSKAFLEDALHQPIRSFAYPFGSREDYTAQTVETVRHCGFQYACSNFHQVMTSDVDRLQLPRRNVLNWTGDEFISWLAKWFADRDQPNS